MIICVDDRVTPGSFAYLSSVKETMGNFAHIKR